MQNVLISKVIDEDNETRAKSDEYADECVAAGDGKEKPKDPHYGTRIMMPSTTKAQFYQNIKNLKGRRAIIVCPEIDSLNVANNWSRDAGANERLMFDTEVGLYILSYITDYFINFAEQFVRINVDLPRIFVGINVIYCQIFLRINVKHHKAE